MGWVEKRVNQAGKVRFTAMFRDVRGANRSAGTFSTERLAARAWHKAELDLASGRIGDSKRGRQTLRSYVEREWFPNHVIEATTRESYTYLLDRYVLPELGDLRMIEILPAHVREWVTRLQTIHGARPPTIRKCKVILDSDPDDGAERSDHVPARRQRREDPACPIETAPSHHRGSVRSDSRGPPGRDDAPAGRDGHRDRSALG